VAHIKDGLRDGRGYVVVGYIANTFLDSELSGAVPGHVHPFTVVASDSRNGLYLLDSAETEPTVYALEPKNLCSFLATPDAAELQFAEREPSGVSNWGMNVWEVTGTGPVPKAGWLDLGVFAIPQNEKPLWDYFMELMPSPSDAVLHAAVNGDQAQKMAAWMDAIERDCSIRRAGKFRFDVNDKPECQDVFALLYRGAAENSDWLEPLAKLFRSGGGHAGTKLEDQRRWEITSVIRFVQGMKYERPYERAHDVRPPEQVLSMRGGDCDSKSLLAAVLLHRLGYHTGVIVLEQYLHAVLALRADEMGWVTSPNTYRVRGPDGREYIATEATDVYELGIPVWKTWDIPFYQNRPGPKVYLMGNTK